MLPLKPKQAFTLIELMTTTAIIAILATVIIVSYNKSRVKARDARRVADINNVSQALKLYGEDAGDFQKVNLQIGGVNVGCTFDYVESVAATSQKNIPSCLDELETGGYISNLPLDPSWEKGTMYAYYYYFNGIGTDQPPAAILNAKLEGYSGTEGLNGSYRTDVWPAGTNWCDSSTANNDYCVVVYKP